MLLQNLLIAIHILAAVFWVGGMAFAYMILRPAAGPLEPQVRLPLWRRVFARFLPWAGVSAAALLVTGLVMIYTLFGSMRATPIYVHTMLGTGLLMMLIYLHLVFAPWRRFRAAADNGAFPDAAKALNQIRMIVGTNLILGIVTILIGSTGRYW